MKLDRINIVLLYNDDRPIKSYFFQLQGLNARLELLITHLIQRTLSKPDSSQHYEKWNTSLIILQVILNRRSIMKIVYRPILN